MAAIMQLHSTRAWESCPPDASKSLSASLSWQLAGR